MLTLIQGKELKPGELGIITRDPDGRMIDPFSICYTLFSVNKDDVKTLAMPPKLIPRRSGNGTYYIDLVVPAAWEGRYDLVWYVQQYEDSPEAQIYEEIMVVRVDPATTSFEAPSMLVTSRPGLTPRIANMIVTTRELLSDTDPDRNYHFRPPTSGKTVANYNTRVGFIWTDSTIIRLLDLTIAQLNTWNPMNLTYYTLNNIPVDWQKAASLGAAAKCLTGEAARWTSESFSYSLNGVSLDIQKQGDYMALGGQYLTEFQTWATALSANRPFTAGLRQSKYLLG
jgi:hypothetical protein